MRSSIRSLIYTDGFVTKVSASFSMNFPKFYVSISDLIPSYVSSFSAECLGPSRSRHSSYS